MSHTAQSLPSQQMIDRQNLEECEKCSEEKSCDQWMTFYKNRANETKRDIQAIHAPYTTHMDRHEAVKRDIINGVRQKRQEERKIDRNEGEIARINDEIQQLRLRMQSHAQMGGSLRRIRQQKLHEMEIYWNRFYHWNLVKNGWSWNDDSKFGRFYYIRPETLECVMNASADDTIESISKRVWKIRKELNVELVSGLTELIFV